MPNKPKSLADYIISLKARINKAAFEAGTYLYGINTPKKKKPPAEKQPLEEVLPAQDSASTLPDSISTLHNKSEDEYTKGLMRFERELATLRQAYKDANDDIDRNALHFRILRLERARKKFLDENE